MRAVFQLLVLSLLAGCAANTAPSLRGPDYFSERTQPYVVLGYFTKPHQLGLKGCLDYEPAQDADSPGFGHCIGPHPSVTLVVKDVIFGHLEEARWELTLTHADKSANMPIGRRKLVLAYPTDFGTIGAYSYIRLARTKDGEWAVPFSSDYDKPDLPCSANSLLTARALTFARPYPTRSLDAYAPEELEKLRTNPLVTVGNGVVRYHAGVLLSDIYALRDRIPKLDEKDRWRVDACLRK